MVTRRQAAFYESVLLQYEFVVTAGSYVLQAKANFESGLVIYY